MTDSVASGSRRGDVEGDEAAERVADDVPGGVAQRADGQPTTASDSSPIPAPAGSDRLSPQPGRSGMTRSDRGREDASDAATSGVHVVQDPAAPWRSTDGRSARLPSGTDDHGAGRRLHRHAAQADRLTVGAEREGVRERVHDGYSSPRPERFPLRRADYPGSMILAIDTSVGTAVAVVEDDGVVLAEVASEDIRSATPKRSAGFSRTSLSAAPESSGQALTHVAAGMGPGLSPGFESASRRRARSHWAAASRSCLS